MANLINNEEKKNDAEVSFSISGVIVLIIASILSYKAGKKAGRNECLDDIAKFTNSIVEEN